MVRNLSMESMYIMDQRIIHDGPRINRDRFYHIVGWMEQTGYNPL